MNDYSSDSSACSGYWYRGAATFQHCHVAKGSADVIVAEHIAWNHRVPRLNRAMTRRSRSCCSLTWLSFTEHIAVALWFAVAKATVGERRVIVAIPDSSGLHWRLEEAGLGTQAGSISGTTSLQLARSRGRDPGARTERQAPARSGGPLASKTVRRRP